MSASLGVRILSIEGSDERLRKRTVLSSAPVSSNWRMKKLASSLVMPIAAKTTEKLSDPLSTLACLAICAASALCGSPAAEKIGSFCPLTRVFMPSMLEMPVWMNSDGSSLLYGLMPEPVISTLVFETMAWAAVPRVAQPVEDAPEHLVGDRYLRGLA